MQIETPDCSQCGGRCVGTVEALPAAARLVEHAPGEFSFNGTDVYWDESKTMTDAEGRAILTCENAHKWPSKVVGL